MLEPRTGGSPPALASPGFEGPLGQPLAQGQHLARQDMPCASPSLPAPQLLVCPEPEGPAGSKVKGTITFQLWVPWGSPAVGNSGLKGEQSGGCL